MKRVLVGLLIAALVGIASFAGPTVGLVGAWYDNGFDFGVGVGMQTRNSLWNLVGAECEFIVSEVYVNPAPDYDPFTDDYSHIYGFGRANLTFRIPGAADGPQWYVLWGIGAPMYVLWDGDAFGSVGINTGTVLGVACESVNGHGASLIGYIDRGYFGVGLSVYVDLFGFSPAVPSPCVDGPFCQ